MDGGGSELRKNSAKSDVSREGIGVASRAWNFFIGTRPPIDDEFMPDTPPEVAP